MCIETLRVNDPAEKNAYTLTLEIKAVFKNYMERQAASKALPPNTYQRNANGNTKTMHKTTSFQYPSRMNRANWKRGLLKQPGKDLALELCQFLLRYLSTPCETTGTSPAELMFKRPIRTRFDLLRPSTAQQVLAKQQAMKELYDGSTRQRTFAPEAKVYTKLEFEKEWAAATVIDVNVQFRRRLHK